MLKSLQKHLFLHLRKRALPYSTGKHLYPDSLLYKYNHYFYLLKI